MEIYGILAHPAKHSLSPAMHNAGFKALGIEAEYKYFDIEADKLESFIERVRLENIKGLSVSKPHKQNIMPMLDVVDDVAREIGAVNTVINRDGELHGTNVDWIGVQEALLEITEIKGKNCVVLGTGGAACAAVFALKRNDAGEIHILNRTVEKAEKLAKKNGCSAGSLKEFGNVNADIVVQATSAGLNDESGVELVHKEDLKASMVVMEMIYTPLMTRISKDAKDAGAKIITGDKMLLHQGFAAFEMWTGQKAPREEMEKAVKKSLILKNI